MIDAQFKKGVLELCLLSLVAEGDLYGYAVLKRVKAHFPDMHDGTIYTVLRRLAADGRLSSYTAAGLEGPARKYYRISEEGRAALREMTEAWTDLCRIVRAMGVPET
jgi:PadR family transcriptional regulator PadR